MLQTLLMFDPVLLALVVVMAITYVLLLCAALPKGKIHTYYIY